MYLAELISAHPLYPAAQHLAAEIDRLRRAEAPSIATGAASAWSTPPLLGPAPFAFPAGDFRRDWLAWQAGLGAPAPVQGAGLPADLAAARDWRYREIDLEVARKRMEAHAVESRRLAQFRESLVRDRLDELTNAGLDLSVPPLEARQQGAETVRRIWEEIEAAVAREQAQSSRKRLPAIEAELAAQAQRRKAQVDAEIQAEVKARRQSGLPAFPEPRPQMWQRMQDFAARPARDTPTQPLPGTAPTAEELREAELLRAEALATYEQTRERQLERLEQGRAQVVRGLLADVRLAAMRVAFQDNLRLTLVPPGSPRGADLTSRVRRRVEQIWSGKELLTAGSEKSVVGSR